MYRQLRDFEHTFDFGGNKQNLVVRITKTDHPLTPFYSMTIGVRNDPKPFLPFLNSNLTGHADFASKLSELVIKANELIVSDKAEHKAAIDKSEAERRKMLAGQGSKDPNANKGMNNVGKTAKKREKERARVSS